MVQWHRSVSWCLERAAHYEHRAERAIDPAARKSFLEAAARWRQSAELYQSMKSVRADPSPDPLPSSSMSPLPRPAAIAQHVLDSLNKWSKWLGLNRAA
jgi:hypothetical protein